MCNLDISLNRSHSQGETLTQVRSCGEAYWAQAGCVEKCGQSQRMLMRKRGRFSCSVGRQGCYIIQVQWGALKILGNDNM